MIGLAARQFVTENVGCKLTKPKLQAGLNSTTFMQGARVRWARRSPAEPDIRDAERQIVRRDIDGAALEVKQFTQFITPYGFVTVTWSVPAFLITWSQSISLTRKLLSFH